jgi:hypothetical protein
VNRRSFLSVAGAGLLAVLTTVAAACSGSGSATPPETVPPGALVVKAGPGIQFDQQNYTATATGGKVTIALVQDDSTQRHTMVVKDSQGILIGQKLDVTKLGAVDTAVYDLAPGTYQLRCDVPGHGAMTATLVVT